MSRPVMINGKRVPRWRFKSGIFRDPPELPFMDDGKSPRCSQCPAPATSMCDGSWLCLKHYVRLHARDEGDGRLLHFLRGDVNPESRSTSWNPHPHPLKTRGPIIGEEG